jgi:hypothetical protein
VAVRVQQTGRSYGPPLEDVLHDDGRARGLVFV